jgi:hypothetical protein
MFKVGSRIGVVSAKILVKDLVEGSIQWPVASSKRQSRQWQATMKAQD